MSKLRGKWMVAGIFVAIALGVIALKAAWATPPHGVTNMLLAGPVVLDDIHVVAQSPAYGAMVKTRGQSDGYVQYTRIAPGGDVGWHSHPGPVFVLITAGTATEYEADDPTLSPILHPAGAGFVDEVGNVHILRNEGNTDVELIAFFLVPRGAPRRIDEPPPE